MFDLLNSIDQLVNLIKESNSNKELDSKTNDILIKLENILNNSDQLNNLKLKESILDFLSKLLLDKEYSNYVSSSCSTIILDLILRLNCDKIDLFCYLSEFICLYPEISEFVYLNFNQNFDPFIFLNQSSSISKQPNKKLKIQNTNQTSIIKILNSCLNYLYFNSNWFISNWNWSNLFNYLNNYQNNNEIKFLIYHCLRLIFNLNDELFYQKLNNEFQQNDLINLRLKYYSIFNNKKVLLPSPAKISNQDQCLIKTTELNKEIISIGGILLKKQTLNDQIDLNKFVLFDSFKLNLQKLALAVRLDQPVLIEGPVGCGKTSMIECLANYVGKTCAPEITKLQMGDQIDRKVLIGSYHCTDIPGQFVWKAGPITRALIDGNWIVLEDIDLAPNELINDIVTILKTKSLDSLSGCSFVNGSVHSSFRIFFTRRLIEGFSEVYRLTDHDIIYKLCERIQFNLPEREELKQIIGVKWPNLDKFSDKLIDIFNLIEKNQLNSRTNRKVTLRDLIKLCNRISLTFNNTNKEAFTLLLDTCDCFINYLNGPERKLELAKQIGVLFNFTNEQVNAIYSKRKPTIEINDNQFKIGRYTLSIKENREFKETNTIFAFNLQSLLLLEQIAASIYHSESLLLVGETGCGKTSTIQFLASKLKKNLVVINLNQQTDSTDIIGGYKPIAFSFIAKKLKNQFEELFKDTFSIDQNISFLNNLLSLFEQEKWKKFITVLDHITSKALIKENLNLNLQKRWNLFKKKLDNLKNREFEKFLAFEFIEGNLVNAIKNGDWVLLDEINLAESETLQFLSYILDENNKSFQLLDKNDDNKIIRHNEFRLFACMNPSTDVGKKELPIGVRNLFTEIFVEELELTSDLQILTQTYIGNLVNSNQIEKIVQLYLRLKKDSKQSLNGYSSGPYYSLRTFCRALRVSSTNLCKNIKKTLYEAFCLSFLTQLDLRSHEQVQQLIFTYLFGKEKINLNKILTPKPDENAIELENFLGYWLPRGTKNPILDTNYILTDSVKRNLFNLIRIISIGRVFPILLQGETSVGKTSMIEWLAQATGNVCYRINNHDHIDLQEYVGNYTVDKFGKLVFKEGLLVEAMRNGYWLILDELNLASTEVLEALNRVLDDNREIFIPEIQDTIKAHPKFLLFATQNPPENYGGRKILSRAFRNRFIELQFDEIPGKELEIILSRRCYLPPSYSKKMVDVFRELRNRRRESGIFAGKSGFVTLRDLFRWGERYKQYSSTIEDNFFNWEQYLANEGYILIGGRVRKEDELLVVKEVLEIKFKTKITDQFLIDNFNELINLSNLSDKFKHIVWTKNSIRICSLLFRALKYKEPVLLVGGTGIGKTTFCQLYAELQQNQLYTVNCHMNTESSDFIGSLRPVRSNSENEHNNKLFEWQDGPLVNAMNNGSTFLVDEISLADDSVLERLNSLLEPKRTLFLAEKTTSEEYIEDQINGENESIKIVAKDSFRFVATMNPGGDYAKKELSPALRNRFTEIWCSSVFDEDDIKKIIVHNLNSNLKDHHIQISDLICEFLNWFNSKIITKTDYSIRDILTIIEFINTTTDQNNEIILPTYLSVINSIELLYIDSIGSSAIYSYLKSSELKNDSKIHLNKLVKKYFSIDVNEINDQTILNVDLNKYYGFKLFYIPYGSNQINQTKSYIMNSKSVNANCCKVLKAMQLSKSILLEGNPGTGKTSLIDALAKAAGYQLIRINLSEQTDINDLFGADLPVEGEEAKFSWRDGPLLTALKTESTWILLDELNLASQSVLEGLNACLDHRGEIFIPELNRTFILNKGKTRIFASQNPHLQGGGRKGLPKSFMNRFITIFIDAFSTEDMIFILENIFNEIPRTIIKKMVSFNEELIEETASRKNFSSAGLPWEFNLRDMTRWCELVVKEKFKLNNEFVFEPEKFIDLIYIDRFRTLDDKNYAIKLFEKHFTTSYNDQLKGFKLTKNYLQIGNSILKRKSYLTSEFDYQLIPQQTKTLESIMKCCEMGWMSILVGDTNVSKSSVINLLSILTGNTLKVLSVNSEMDSTELLGGFEQQDCARHYKELEKEIWSKLKILFKNCFINNDFDQFKKILDNWFTRNNNDQQQNNDDIDLILNKLTILKNLLNFIDDDDRLKKKCINLIELITRTRSINGNGTFEWIDSVLIESIQNGYWLLIENANLCSASVLDRINSLLEPNGFLIINERGSIDNEIPIIRPHPG